jgi:hypothetical protein
MSPGDPYTLGENQVRYSGNNKIVAKGPSGHPLSGLTKLDQKDYLAESWRAAMRSDGTIDRSKLVPFRTGATGKTPKIGDVREIKSSGKIITQEFDGEDWVDYTSTPQWNPKQGPLATASSSVVNKTGKKLGEELAKAVVENQGKMQAYKENLNYMNESEKILDSGVITGVGAEWITSLGNVLQERLGIDTGDAVSNTEAFAASMANQAIAVMGSGKLGGGTGLSDKDLEFAKKMAASEISISEKALRRIMNINRKAMRYAIKEHNRKAGSVSKWAKRNKVDLPYGVEVDMSDYKPYQKPPPKPILVEDAEAEDIDDAIKRRFGR